MRFGKLTLNVATALRERFHLPYTRQHFQGDLMAGIIVGLVAIPLSMALAIATGVAPQFGLYTAIIAGLFTALLGGSRYQITGPTAAFVVILVPIVNKFGFHGLLVAGLFSGLILLLMGLAGMGRLIQFIPYTVTTGFTSGIAVVIATIQLKDFFGLQMAKAPEGVAERLYLLWQARPTMQFSELAVGLATLLLLIFWPRLNRKIPSPLVALASVSLVAYFLQKNWPTFHVETIASRFGGIPQKLPELHFPWFASDPSSGPSIILNLQNLRALLPSAFTIALLGAIESLLSAVIADGITRTKHDPNSELIGLGVGNMLCPFFGGIPATGAVARTTTSIRAGAESPLAAVVHSVFIILVIVCLAPVVSQVPMSALAALLLMVAYRMSEAHNFIHIVRVAPRSDVVVLITCFMLTVVFDMVIGVSVGVVLAALLFMGRMADLTSGKALHGPDINLPDLADIPHKVVYYQIAGPLFFGATQRAIEALSSIADEVRVVIFDLRQVPVMDVTGLVALESTIDNLCKSGRHAILFGVARPVKDLLTRSATISHSNNVAVFDLLDDAVKMAKKIAS